MIPVYNLKNGYYRKLCMAQYYPVNLLLKEKNCLVAGAGKVAERKVKRLLECGAKVLVISPEIAPGLKNLAEKEKISYKKRKLNLTDLSGAYLVIAATSDAKLNADISNFCRATNILINVVDSPEECSFTLPALIMKRDLTITISTEGISPALAKKIRQDMGAKFGAEYDALLRIMKEIRPLAIKEIKNIKTRKAFFQKILEPDILNLLRRKKYSLAKKKIITSLKKAIL